MIEILLPVFSFLLFCFLTLVICAYRNANKQERKGKYPHLSNYYVDEWGSINIKQTVNH